MPTMGFLDHLEELRTRLVYSIAAVAVGFFACWWKVETIYDIMQRPIMKALRDNGMSERLVYLNPTEPFNLYLKIAALAGLFLTSPFVLYQVWMFISPGLYRNEKRYVVPFMVSTIALFTAGGYFGYKVVYPQALGFLIHFGRQFQPMITIGEYTSLFLEHHPGHGPDLRDADSHFLSGADGHCHRQLHVEKFPLRHPCHFYRGGYRHPDSRCFEHVYLCRAHDRAVRLQHRNRMGGSSQAAPGA